MPQLPPKEPKIIKTHCPNCGPDRNAEIVAQHIKKWADELAPVWSETRIRILVCKGCDEAYVQKWSIFSEDSEYRHTGPDPEDYEAVYNEKVTYWPAPATRARPEWLDSLQIKDRLLLTLLTDVYTALDNDLRILAAIGLRTVFDRASELFRIDHTFSFDKKLGEMLWKGKIGVSEKQHLEILTNAGSAAAHRGWQPTPDDLDTLMSIAESFLYRTFIIDRAAKKLGKRIPKRAKRKNKQ